MAATVSATDASSQIHARSQPILRLIAMAITNIRNQDLCSKRASVRYSTISTSPSFSSQNSESSTFAEIKQLTNSLSRLENKNLAAQRVVLSKQKSDTMSKLALGAKVERALGLRMTNQDAVYKPKRMTVLSEKVEAVKA